MSLNIKSKAVAATSFLHLKDSAENLMFADEDKTQPVGVIIYGPGSKEFQQAQVKVNNRAVKRLQKRGNTDQTVDVKLKEQSEYLADITAGFQHLDYDGLQGRQLALAVYSDPSIGFIGDQVSEHVKDWSNFSQASATA